MSRITMNKGNWSTRNPNPPPETAAMKFSTEREREAFIMRHMPLVKHIAKKLVRTHPNLNRVLDDIISAGYLALVRAADGFDEQATTKFSTYAGHAIRREVDRSVLRQLPATWIPHHVWDSFRAARSKGEKSIDDPHFHQAIKNAPPPNERLAVPKEHEIESVEALLAPLNDRQRTAIVMRYGIYGGIEHSLAEIEEAIGAKGASDYTRRAIQILSKTIPPPPEIRN